MLLNQKFFQYSEQVLNTEQATAEIKPTSPSSTEDVAYSDNEIMKQTTKLKECQRVYSSTLSYINSFLLNAIQLALELSIVHSKYSLPCFYRKLWRRWR